MGEQYIYICQKLILISLRLFIFIYMQVQAAKKYLPVAIRYAKKYYQQRKQNKMNYNDMNNRYNDPSCK